MPRRLTRDDFLYRVIDPEHRDENGPLAVAFEDPGKNYESLSFYVASVATPADALRALAPYQRAKKTCKTGKREPTPAEMYANGYRVARVSARLVLDGIDQTRQAKRPLSIAREGGHDFDQRGHLNLENGRFYSQTLSDPRNGTAELSEAETLN